MRMRMRMWIGQRRRLGRRLYIHVHALVGGDLGVALGAALQLVQREDARLGRCTSTSTSTNTTTNTNTTTSSSSTTTATSCRAACLLLLLAAAAATAPRRAQPRQRQPRALRLRRQATSSTSSSTEGAATATAAAAGGATQQFGAVVPVAEAVLEAVLAPARGAVHANVARRVHRRLARGERALLLRHSGRRQCCAAGR